MTTVKRPLGLTLPALHEFVELCGGDLKKTATERIKTLVLDMTRVAGVSYAALLEHRDSPHVAPANVFLSHAYSYPFLDVVEAVAAWEARQAETGRRFFYYFDLFSVNQHSQTSVVPFEVLRDEFAGSITAIGRVLLILSPYYNPLPLQRAWCVFEMATALTVGAALEVVMPHSDAVAFQKALLDDFGGLIGKICEVDVERATAREPADLANIRRVIQGGGGYLRTNQLVVGALREWMAVEGSAALAALPGATARALSPLSTQLALLLQAGGRLREAETAFRAALEGRRAALGDAHRDTLSALSGLAVLLRLQGRLEEAAPLYEEILALQRAELGPRHPDTLGTLNNISVLLRTRGQLAEAEPLAREVLESRCAALGGEHADSVDAANNLAKVLWYRGKLDEAEQLFREALLVHKKMFGEAHTESMRSATNLAHCMSDRGGGSLPQAEALYRNAWASFRRSLGDTNMLTFWPQVGLACTLRRQGRFDEALPLAQDAARDSAAALDALHPVVLFALHELGVVLRLLGARERARPFARAAAEGRTKLLGSQHRDAIASALNYARLMGDAEGAQMWKARLEHLGLPCE